MRSPSGEEIAEGLHGFGGGRRYAGEGNDVGGEAEGEAVADGYSGVFGEEGVEERIRERFVLSRHEMRSVYGGNGGLPR